MRMVYGAVFGILSLLLLAAMFPPEGNAYGTKALDPGTLPSIVKVEQTILPTAPQPVSVTLPAPQPFDPRIMTLEDLKERRAQAVAAHQQALAKDQQTLRARQSDIRNYALQEARDAAFDKSTRAAAQTHRLGCKEADNMSCLLLGNLYLKGAGVLSDQPLAVALYSSACEAGYQHGCMMVEKAQYYYIDRSPVKDEPRLTVEEVAAIRAARRETTSLLQDALADHNDDFRPDYYGRVNRVKEGCRKGVMADCIQLGRYFYSEYAGSEQWGVKHDVPDREAGRALYLHACDLGDAIGCWNYAEAHYGMGEDDVPEIYLAYYEKSCEMGFGVACQNIGFRHELGAEIQEDEAKAAAFYNRGCDLGDAYACHSLSSLWDVGDDLLRNVNDLRACLHGNSLACEFMADDFRYGKGDVPKNLTLARELLTYGCEDETVQNKDEDDRNACKALARMD